MTVTFQKMKEMLLEALPGVDVDPPQEIGIYHIYNVQLRCRHYFCLVFHNDVLFSFRRNHSRTFIPRDRLGSHLAKFPAAAMVTPVTVRDVPTGLRLDLFLLFSLDFSSLQTRLDACLTGQQVTRSLSPDDRQFSRLCYSFFTDHDIPVGLVQDYLEEHYNALTAGGN